MILGPNGLPIAGAANGGATRGMMRNVGARQAAMFGGGKPYDEEVEWLKSSGGSFIITNHIPTNIDIIHVDYLLNEYDPGNVIIFSSRNGAWDSYPNHWLFLKASDLYQIWAFTTFQTTSVILSHHVKTTVTLNLYDKIISFSGGSYGSEQISVGTEDQNQNPIFLFGINQNSRQVTIYNYSAIRNGKLVVDMIPVRIGTVGYMYDRVSGKLFGNSGTGEFILGPDKV